MIFNGKILLVDDEAHIRKFLAMLLKQISSATVIECDNGTSAVEVFAQEQPGLIILDVNMPGIDGIECLRRIRAINPDCVAVVLTSIANRQTVENAIDEGASHYIRKDNPPTVMKELFKEILAENFESAA